MTFPPTPPLKECQQLDLPCLSVANRHSLSDEDSGCFVWRAMFNTGTERGREVDETSDLHVGEPYLAQSPRTSVKWLSVKLYTRNSSTGDAETGGFLGFTNCPI